MKDRFVELGKRWDKVETRLKEIEQISGDARIPAINELRYAGRQLVDAIVKELDGGRGVETNLKVAGQYIRNADHDITDAVTDFIKGRINHALSEYGTTIVTEAFPRAMEMKEIAEQIDTQIRASRGDRSKRDAIYEALYTSHVERMVQLYKEYEKERPRILYRAVKLERKYALSKWFNLIVGIGGIIGLIFAVFVWIVPYSDFKTWLLTFLAAHM